MLTSISNFENLKSSLKFNKHMRDKNGKTESRVNSAQPCLVKVPTIWDLSSVIKIHLFNSNISLQSEIGRRLSGYRKYSPSASSWGTFKGICDNIGKDLYSLKDVYAFTSNSS